MGIMKAALEGLHFVVIPEISERFNQVSPTDLQEAGLGKIKTVPFRNEMNDLFRAGKL